MSEHNQGMSHCPTCGMEKPQPQVAPLPDIPGPCGLFIAKERTDCSRILAAIKDDELKNKVLNNFLDKGSPSYTKLLNAYRAALLEHINAKENPNG